MSVIDKCGILKDFGKRPYAIELGCGPSKHRDELIGIDLLDYEGVDIVGDVFDVLAEFPSSSVGYVYSHHFVEHVSDFERLMRELARVTVPGARIETVAPHFSNPHFYSDYSHRTFFGLYSMDYFCSESRFSRKVPKYGESPKFDLESVYLNFKSYRPYYVRHGLKKIQSFVFNSCRYMQEFYEENLVYLFPCYEVRYVIRRRSDNFLPM